MLPQLSIGDLPSENNLKAFDSFDLDLISKSHSRLFCPSISSLYLFIILSI